MAARKTIDMINEKDIANKVMISSFNNEVLDAVISISATSRSSVQPPQVRSRMRENVFCFKTSQVSL